MQSQLFIPKKCKVGFNVRSDTYTGKLGYVIYNDGTVWRKEKSWETWRHKEEGTYHEYVKDEKGAFIMNPTGGYKTTLETYGPTVKPIEFDNVPHAGFTLNKGVERNGYWGNGHSMCRIYDDRGFEFEISISNLMFILMSTDCLRRGLEGEFVYGWNKNELILIPTNCPEYLNSIAFTSLQAAEISIKDLIPGCTYHTKRQKDLVYLGRFSYYGGIPTREHVFADNRFGGSFEMLKDAKTLAGKVTDVVDNYAELVEEFQKSDKYGSIKGHKTESQHYFGSNYRYHNETQVECTGPFFKEIAPNKFHFCEIYQRFEKNSFPDKTLGYEVKVKKAVTFTADEISIRPATKKDDKLYTKVELEAMGFVKLGIEMKNGKHINLNF